MTKIQIRKVNGVPMGRPVNEHPQFVLHGQQNEINPEWLNFEQSVTEHEAPGFEEGEAEGELVTEYYIYGTANNYWTTDNSNYKGKGTRQIWVVSTSEKAEVKEPLSEQVKSESSFTNMSGMQLLNRGCDRERELIELGYVWNRDVYSYIHKDWGISIRQINLLAYDDTEWNNLHKQPYSPPTH